MIEVEGWMSNRGLDGLKLGVTGVTDVTGDWLRGEMVVDGKS